jgi:N-acetylglucosamine kinase-like BadF-type ATPase
MNHGEVLAIDLGQSGTSIRLGDFSSQTPRGKHAGENTLDALRAAIESIELPEKISTDCVALSCTGLYGQVPNPQKYLDLCSKFFGATKVAVIDDGFASYVGALKGQDGVVLTIGGGVVSIAGLKGQYSHRDGLGSTFGDEGGGFWLGRNAISKALASLQNRIFDQRMHEYFKDDITAYYELDVRDGSQAQILAINTAKKVLDAADLGIPSAVAIANKGAFLLAQTVISTWQGVEGDSTDEMKFVVQGGPAKNKNYVDAILRNVSEKLPNTKLVESAGNNLNGAAWIAEHLPNNVPPFLKWASK